MWNILTVPTVWYFNCPQQYGMFLLFRECGILTVLAVWNVLTVPTVWNFNCTDSVVYELSR
jgi:hypothetical protein